MPGAFSLFDNEVPDMIALCNAFKVRASAPQFSSIISSGFASRRIHGAQIRYTTQTAGAGALAGGKTSLPFGATPNPFGTTPNPYGTTPNHFGTTPMPCAFVSRSASRGGLTLESRWEVGQTPNPYMSGTPRPMPAGYGMGPPGQSPHGAGPPRPPVPGPWANGTPQYPPPAAYGYR